MRRLAVQAPVGVADAACLAFRRPGACGACTEACPTAVLAIAGQRLELRGDCLGCGRCHAACPTGALRVSGFAVENDEFAAEEILVDCWMAPRSAGSAHAAIRVPCLFGLSVAQIVHLRSVTLPRPIRVADHGWCGACTAGRGLTLADRLAQAGHLMRELGLPEALQPEVESLPLPIAGLPAAIPSVTGQRMLGRREFFSGLLREAMVPAVVAGDSPSPESVRIRREPIGLGVRRKLLECLTHLAEVCGGQAAEALPAVLFHRVSLGDGCKDHGVCVANCPTGALRRWRDAELGGIEFDSADCIGCGVCRDVCPESALRIEFGVGYQTVTRLGEFVCQRCAACGSEFARRRDAAGELCGNCFKSRRLARSAYSQLFGAPG